MAHTDIGEYIGWQTDISGTPCPPTVSGECVYLGTRGNELHAIDMATGNKRWTFEADHTVYPPTVAGDSLYAGSFDDKLYSFDRMSGRVQWVTDVGSTVFPPAANRSSVFAGTYDGRLLCVDSTDGAVQWEFHAEEPMCVKFQPIIQGENVCAGSYDGKFYLIDVENGDEKRSLHLGGKIKQMAQRGSDIYVGADNGAIQAFSGGSRETMWSKQSDSAIKSLEPAERHLLATTKNKISALSASAGSVTWEEKIETPINSMTGCHTHVCVTTSEGELFVFDLDGTVLLETTLPAEAETIQSTNSQLFIDGADGTLEAVQIAEMLDIGNERKASERVSGLYTDDTYPPAADGHYICLSPDADSDTYRSKLKSLTQSSDKKVLIVDGNNRSIPTKELKTEAKRGCKDVTVVDRRREILEEELRDLSCKAAVHSRKHIDGTRSLPDWLSGKHYFRYLQPPEGHSCPTLPVVALKKYFPQSVEDRESQRLYWFAKKSERGGELPHKRQFIFGLSDLISRRILRATTEHDAIVPVPGHDGGVSFPLEVSTAVIHETTPIRRRHVLRRQQTTEQQKTQESRIARYDNVADSLTVDADLTGQRIIVFDDICTSGASLNYAAKALYEAGAEDVIGMVYGTTAKKGGTITIEGPGATIEDLQLLFGGGAE